MTVRLATDKDQPAWDDFVLNNPQAGPYHLYGWKKAVEKGYGHKAYYFQAEDESGKIVGILPLISFRMPWRRKTLVCLPFCDYAGPAGDTSARDILLRSAIDIALENGAKDIELRCIHKFEFPSDVRPYRVLSHKVRMLLDLPDSSEALWKGFKSKLRSQIRRPQKEGLLAKVGHLELLDDFYRVFSINMRDLGSPVHSLKWFRELFAAYKSHFKVAAVYLPTGEPVAAGIILHTTHNVCIPWASSLRAYNRLSPNMLLYWTFLAWAADNGYKVFDFGRSTPGEGTFRFKKQWGAEPSPLYWYHISPESPDFPRAEDVPDSVSMDRESTARNAAIAIWRKLPLTVANILGASIRKYVSL